MLASHPLTPNANINTGSTISSYFITHGPRHARWKLKRFCADADNQCMAGNVCHCPNHPRCAVRRSVWWTALFLCLISFAISRWVIWPVKVSGDSMVPNYQDGQPNFINKLAYLTREPQRGDVVGVRVRGEFYIKRVIGLPGERIEFRRGTVIVNGRPLHEPYIERPLLWALPPVEVAPDHYFIMGDNRTQSMLGAVHRERIVGKAVF